jgi:8-oxo-dGTP pyrophosphatase MutT (NUDIX family)
MDPETAEVKAAGCVVWRRGAENGVEVAVIHRPRYDDWSLPKGKLDRGEGWEQAAAREVMEEIGQSGRLGDELDPVFYEDRKGRAKAVRYWLMEVPGDAPFEVNDEVDVLEWLDPGTAERRLSYDVDRRTVARAAELLA